MLISFMGSMRQRRLQAESDTNLTRGRMSMQRVLPWLSGWSLPQIALRRELRCPRLEVWRSELVLWFVPAIFMTLEAVTCREAAKVNSVCQLGKGKMHWPYLKRASLLRILLHFFECPKVIASPVRQFLGCASNSEEYCKIKILSLVVLELCTLMFV